ncbi:MAG: hypothetical protein QOG50_2648 [Actinomycetota bacterium]|nr:hypothetical protein [Actinomycetota bacterium]
MLVGAFGAAYAVAVDAVSFVVSTVATFAIRGREPPRAPTNEPRNLRREIREGLSFVLRHPILKKVVGCTATSNFFSGAAFAIEAVFLVRILHASPGVIGLVLSLGSVGGLLGAIFAGRIARRVGTARIIWLSLKVTAPFGFLIPFAFRGYGVLLVAGALFAFSAGSVVYNTAQVSFRQAVCPPDLLGRMNASVRFVVWGTMPLGALAGGALGTLLGLRVTEFLCALGGWAAVLWVINSPLFGMRDVPEPEADATALEVPYDASSLARQVDTPARPSPNQTTWTRSGSAWRCETSGHGEIGRSHRRCAARRVPPSAGVGRGAPFSRCTAAAAPPAGGADPV